MLDRLMNTPKPDSLELKYSKVFFMDNVSDIFLRVKLKYGYSKIIAVVDENILRKWGNEILADHIFAVESGEKSKSRDSFAYLLERIMSSDIDKNTTIVAIGGGSTGDLAGFAASVTLRGLRLINIPTTLLAQIDAAYGGKNGINSRLGKNTLGTIYHSEEIYCSTEWFSTLSTEQFISGFAEMLKYGFILNSSFLEHLDEISEQLLMRNKDTLVQVIKQCMILKDRIVSEDERDKKDFRRILNFGHSFAHALIKLSNDTIIPGFGLGLGISIMLDYSWKEKYLTEAEAKRGKEILAHFGLPTTIRELSYNFKTEDLIEALKSDRKSYRGKISLVVLEKIGCAKLVNDVNISQLENFIETYICNT